ncbi:MAG TPA: hypothetical protein ENK57_16565 [Polyangiaceae bacterium]|nr:hypothetical protein [Polyangiaceae bacterium]
MNQILADGRGGQLLSACYTFDMAPFRRWLAVIVLAIFALYEASGVISWASWPGGDAMAACFMLFTVSIVVAGVGVAMRAFWGRALALGIGVAGLLDAASVLASSGPDGDVLLFAVMPLSLLVLLKGSRMRRYFARAGWTKMWLEDDLRLRTLGVAIMAAVPMVAGLVRYAATQAWWVGADDRAIALGTTVAVTMGAIAALKGRTAGLLVMFAGACAAMGLAFESIVRLHNPLCGSYSYADGFFQEMAMVSIVPSALAMVAAMGVFAPAMWRFLRR